MRTRRVKDIVAGLAVLALVGTVVSCSSSGSGKAKSTDSTTSSGSAGTNGSAPSGDPVVIGTICSCSGPLASVYGAISAANNAWVKSINAAGGINGHPVKLNFVDDQDDPSKALQAAKQLVEQNKVVAIVAMQSGQSEAFRKYVEGKGIPVIGGATSEPGMSASTNFFPSGSNYFAEQYLIAAQAKRDGKTKMALLVCAEAPVCAGFLPPYGSMLKLLGMSLAYGTKVSASAPDYTAQCLAAKQSGAEFLLATTVSSLLPRLYSNCSQQNYHPQYFQQLGGANPTIVANANAQGTFVVESNLPVVDTGTPGGQAMQSALDKYAPSIRSNSAFTNTVSQTFAGFELFKAAAVAAKITPTSTSADLLAGLYSLKNETLGGLSSPLTFVKGQPTIVSCGFTEKIENKKLVELNNGQPTCVPQAEREALYKNWGQAYVAGN